MAIYIDEQTLDSELLDLNNKGIIVENFTYVLKNLMDFVDPQYTYDSVNKPMLRGGKRRAVRGERSEKLGYIYKTAASKSKISNKGIKVIQAFGQNVSVEEWEVSHGHVIDSDLGEEYPTTSSDKAASPRGPYTCLMTARLSISKKQPTRCYLQCNCKDFDTTFYEKLNELEYTNPKSLPKSTGSKVLAPAMCKHLYAIYSQYYRDLINDTEKFSVDASPILNAASGSVAPVPAIPITQPTKSTGPVKTKEEAIKLIATRLKQEYSRISKIEAAYLDSRAKQSGGGSYHLYPFYVIRINGVLKIAYRNKNNADPALRNNNHVQQLVIVNNPSIWALFSKSSDQVLLWDLIRQLGPMPNAMQKVIAARQGYDVYMENVQTQQDTWDFSSLAEDCTNSSSSILLSISELS